MSYFVRFLKIFGYTILLLENLYYKYLNNNKDLIIIVT